MRLNATAKAHLRDCGISQAAYARRWSSLDGTWRGDACGCPDDRCIGHHHDEGDNCGCIEELARQLLAEVHR